MPYEVKLTQFEGPLDLLLHLIEKAELDISEVHISEITNQYLVYMGQIEELDMDSASEFISVASTLLYIKSRALLPKSAPQTEQNEEDPEKVLLQHIREYKAFKEASEKLRESAQSATRIYCRLPEEYPLPQPEVNISGVSSDQLYHAFASILFKQKEQRKSNAIREVHRDVYTISDRIVAIRSALKKRNRIAFSNLFLSRNRMEIVVTFMALLEMLSEGELLATQDRPYGIIYIENYAIN